MPEKFQITFDSFAGQDSEVDPSQTAMGSPWKVNFVIAEKGTATKTRNGFLQVTTATRAQISSVDYPTLRAIYLQDYGFNGNLYVVINGDTRDRCIACQGYVNPNGTSIGSSSSRTTLVIPPSGSSTIYWPRGASAGGNTREQIDWLATMPTLFNKLVVFMPHQTPLQVVGTLFSTYGICRPKVSFGTITAGSGTGGTGDYRYVFTLKRMNGAYDQLLDESPGSIPSSACTGCTGKATIAAFDPDNYMHPATLATHVGIYRKKVSSTETWSNYYWVDDVAIATFTSSGFVDQVTDDSVLQNGVSLDEAARDFHGFGIAAYNGDRLACGYQADWTGKVNVTNANATITMVPTSGTASQSRYADYMNEEREIQITDSAGTTRIYTILYTYQSSSVNYAVLATPNRDVDVASRLVGYNHTTKAYEGSTENGIVARIPGDKRTVWFSYRGFKYSQYRHAFYSMRLGDDTEGDLTGIGVMRNDWLICYERSLYLISGGGFADDHTNNEPSPNWYHRAISTQVGLISPKTLQFDKDGRAYGFGGPSAGVWMTNGLEVRSISDDALHSRLNSFGDAKFAVGMYDPNDDFYWLVFPYSDDQHGFWFDFGTGQWGEGNHLSILSAPPQAPVTASLPAEPADVSYSETGWEELGDIPETLEVDEGSGLATLNGDIYLFGLE